MSGLLWEEEHHHSKTLNLLFWISNAHFFNYLSQVNQEL
jgi:hypothetical protein